MGGDNRKGRRRETSELDIEDNTYMKIEELLNGDSDVKIDRKLLKEVLLGLNARISRLEAWKQRHEEGNR